MADDYEHQLPQKLSVDYLRGLKETSPGSGVYESVNIARALITTGASEADVNALDARVDTTETDIGALETATSGLASTKADKTVTVTGAGMATGGGSLSTDRVITVTPATNAEMRARTANKPADAAGVGFEVDTVVAATIGPFERTVTSVRRRQTNQVGLDDYTLSLNPRTVAFAAACEAAGSPISVRRQNTHSRLMDRLDRWGITALNASGCGIWLLGDSKAQAKINHLNPGTNDLVEVGSPTYTVNIPGSGGATRGWAAASASDYLDTGIDAFSFPGAPALWVDVTNRVISTGYDIGDNVALCSLQIASASNSNFPRAFMGNSSISNAPGGFRTAGWTGTGWHMAQRELGTTRVDFRHYGLSLGVDTASTFTGVVDSAYTIRILQAAGVSPTRSQNTIRAAAVLNEMSEDQCREFHAATTDYMWSVIFGDLFIYDVGVGPSVIREDVIVYGWSMPSVCYAYECARRGLSVAMVGDWNDETPWDAGGMPVNGLANIDINDATKVTGLFREMLTYINVNARNSTDGSTQQNLSPEPRYWSAVVRRLFDPDRSTGILPGYSVKFYATGGITGIGKSGTVIKSLTTRDGRTFYGKVFGLGDYDGDGVYHAGIPYIIGRAAAAVSGPEASSGFKYPAGLRLPTGPGGETIEIDPYNTPGDATSGLLPVVENPRGFTVDGTDTAVQALNIRLTCTVGTTRYVPWEYYMPADYDDAKYEAVGRYYEAYEDAVGSDIVFGTGAVNVYPLSSTNQRDVNGRGILSLDVPNSGVHYSACGQDITARRGVWRDVRDWEMGLFYWWRNSGDSRIPTDFVTTASSYYLDALNHLAPGTHGLLFVGNQCYRREPIYKAQNTGAMGSGVAILDANDLTMTDGTTPRSIKTIATICYDFDAHYHTIAADGGFMGTLGTLNNTIVGGVPGATNNLAPWPFEVSVPDKTVVSNACLLTTPSMTSVAWAPARMEPFLGQAAECLAVATDLAIKGDIAIQDIDYDDLRTEVLASPYTIKPALPQTN